ncbi:hypothetical protein HRI_001819400 [Hibiscus trionum]|uniref:PB1 domain-containing protein n=1 Tax=Hibiscus trionum TaxID=183268 RepID=A0A9W7LZ09_HIBTR|nr:hypothetical protein HRI_001819400 [Hibiscus trionum]
MGKPTGKKRFQETGKSIIETNKQKKGSAADRASAKPFDNDMAIFINMSQELKEEGNRLFLKRDHEGAMLKYEKALNLLPKSHIDVAYLRNNMAACYMHMGIGEYPRAINECDLALEASPKYSKALLRRAKCYEALNRLDLAYKDVYNVLTIEPNNSSALEVLDSVKKAMDEQGITVNENELGLFDNEISGIARLRKLVNERLKKKRMEGKSVDKAVEDKAVVEEKVSLANEAKDEEVVMKTVEQEKKLVEEEKATRVRKSGHHEKSKKKKHDEEEKASLADEIKYDEVVMKTMEPEKRGVEEVIKATRVRKVVHDKFKKKRRKHEGKSGETHKKSADHVTEEKAVEDKAVVEEKVSLANEVKNREVVLKTAEQEKKAVVEEKVSLANEVMNGEIVTKTAEQEKKAVVEEKVSLANEVMNGDVVIKTTEHEMKAVIEEKASLADEVMNGDVFMKTTEQEMKAVVEEIFSLANEVMNGEVIMKSAEQEKKYVEEEKTVVKLVLRDDIRWAQLPSNCTIDLLWDIIRDRFPGLQGVIVKYRDPEGDLITLTSTDDLRLAESVSRVAGGSLKFYIVEVSPDHKSVYEGVSKQDVGHKSVYEGISKVDVRHKSVYEGVSKEDVVKSEEKLNHVVENGEAGTCVEDWIVQFALLFKNHVGVDSDSCLDLHELGMKLHLEAMTDAVTSEDAQELFESAADKFQEMAALALFNWGNVHMSRARKHVSLAEDSSRESTLAQVKIANEWAQKEYVLAAKRYEEAVRIKPDFHEGLLALGQQQFEQAKLCWYHAIACGVDLETGTSEEVLQLYNKAEECMDKGMQIWEETEERRLNGLSKFDKYRTQLQEMGIDRLFKDASPQEVAEQTANMSSQIYMLWGALLYERSVVEYKIGLPTWDECLEVAVEKFGLAGASRTDLAVMIKNHCSNQNTSDGLGFKIDEIIQAWNEMYDVKRWQTGVPSFRLEPLFRRRAPKLLSILELL